MIGIVTMEHVLEVRKHDLHNATKK